MFLPDRLLFWLPGFLVGLLIVAARRRCPGPITLIVCSLLLFAGFYLTALVFRVPMDVLSAGGWLLGPFPEGAAWSFPLTSEFLDEVNWPALFSALPGVLPAVMMGTIALLLNATGLELIIKKDLDINRELVGAGAANLAAALAGGLPGYHAISLSTLNHNFAREKRLPSFFVALFLVVVLVFGTQLLSFVPRMVLGALLVYLGADLIYEWVFEVWKKFPRIDAAIVMVILVTIVLKDFLWGIGVGMVLTIVLFVVSYSRVNVVRYAASGNSFRSRHNRRIEHERVLELHGDKLHGLRLEGFIFFGTANHLYENVKALLKPGPNLPIEYVLLDFSLVHGLDTTGLLSFEKMVQAARDRKATLVFSGLNGRVREQFQNGGFLEASEGLLVLQNLDRAVEWCETQLIDSTALNSPVKKAF